jgi:hypothetical protein
VVLVAIAYMQAGPIWYQLLGHRHADWMMTWTMYYTAATDVCDVTFTHVTRRGERLQLDRWRDLGHEPWYEAPRWVRRLGDEKAVRRVANELCKGLPRGDSLEVEGRCGDVKGWKPMELDGQVCRGKGR